MKIGFFDSGLGGLTVFRKVLNCIPAQYIYLADNKNNPYGIKPREDVIGYILDNIKILVKLKCDIIVIACNTATSVAIDIVRKKYNNICIIGTEPAVKVATDQNKLNKNILVAATTMTLNEEKLNNLIKNLDAQDIVQKIALDKLVEFAESGETNTDKILQYLEAKLKKYDWSNFSHLVLGCTHFPIYINQIRQALPSHINIVDGSDGIVKNIYKKIEENSFVKEQESSIKLLFTKKNDIFIDNFRKISKLNDFDVEII